MKFNCLCNLEGTVSIDINIPVAYSMKRGMIEMKCAIVGYGHVGRAMAILFPKAVVYDEPLGIGNKDSVNKTDACFVCVPAPRPSWKTASAIRILWKM